MVGNCGLKYEVLTPVEVMYRGFPRAHVFIPRKEIAYFLRLDVSIQLRNDGKRLANSRFRILLGIDSLSSTTGTETFHDFSCISVVYWSAYRCFSL